MPVLSCYVDDRTLEILEREARERGRTVEDLAEAAIAEAAIALTRPAADPRQGRLDLETN